MSRQTLIENYFAVELQYEISGSRRGSPRLASLIWFAHALLYYSRSLSGGKVASKLNASRVNAMMLMRFKGRL